MVCSFQTSDFRGAPGLQGEKGMSIKDVVYDSVSQKMIFQFSDGTFSVPDIVVKGPAGPKGEFWRWGCKLNR